MNIVKTFGAISGLANVSRYSMISLGRRESVLEHLGMVTITANLLATRCNLICVGCVDATETSLRASVHDIDELVTGDVPRPTKYFSKETRAMFRIIEDRGVRKVAREMTLDLELQSAIIEAHKTSKSGYSGMIVAVADVMAVCYKVWEEVLVRGNMSMAPHAVNVEEQLSRLRTEIPELFCGTRLPAATFLVKVLWDCSYLMAQAAKKCDGIHGAIPEEMVQ